MTKITQSIYIAKLGTNYFRMFDHKTVASLHQDYHQYVHDADVEMNECFLIRYNPSTDKFYYAFKGHASGKNTLVLDDELIQDCVRLLDLCIANNEKDIQPPLITNEYDLKSYQFIEGFRNLGFRLTDDQWKHLTDFVAHLARGNHGI